MDDLQALVNRVSRKLDTQICASIHLWTFKHELWDDTTEFPNKLTYRLYIADPGKFYDYPDFTSLVKKLMSFLEEGEEFSLREEVQDAT